MAPARQDSFDLEGSSEEDEEFAAEKGGKAPAKGRKKDDSSQSQRKAQNRIAQREFRQRKQQYIRELETRVEVLSANSDERSDHLRDVLRALMAENTQLRDLVKDLGKLIGEGLGSCLPRLGMTPDIYQEIVNRGPAETALDAFVKSKEAIQGFSGPSHNPGTAVNGNPFEKKKDNGDAAAAGAKRKRAKEEPKPAAKKPHMHDPAALSVAGTTMTAGKGKGKEKEQPVNAVASGSASHSPVGGAAPSTSGTSSGTVPSLSHDSTSNGRGPPLPPPPVNNNNNNNNIISNNPYDYSQFASNPSQYGSSQSNLGQSINGYSNLFDLDPVFGSPSLSNPYRPQQQYPSQHQSYLPQSISALRQPNFSHDPSGGSPQDSPGSLASTSSPRIVAYDGSAEAGPSAGAGGRVGTEQDCLPRKMREGETPESYFASDEVKQAVDVLPTSKQVAMQLIAYHLTNYRQNSNYHLPPSLVPTVLQRTIPHDHLIDGIPFASLRDQMILMRDRFDLGAAMHALFSNYTIYGEDVISSDSWEISEAWLRQFPMLAHEALIATTNKWRIQRGAPPLSLADITGSSS